MEVCGGREYLEYRTFMRTPKAIPSRNTTVSTYVKECGNNECDGISYRNNMKIAGPSNSTCSSCLARGDHVRFYFEFFNVFVISIISSLCSRTVK